MQALWQEALGQLSEMLAEFASRAEELILEAPDRLAAQFAAKYNSCKLFCERPDQQREIESALTTVFGRPMKVDFKVKADEPPAVPVERVSPAVMERRRMAEKSAHPVVRRAAELFQAQITRIEDQGGSRL